MGVGPLNVAPPKMKGDGIVKPCGPRAKNPPFGRLPFPMNSNETSGPSPSGYSAANLRFSNVPIVALCEYPKITRLSEAAGADDPTSVLYTQSVALMQLSRFVTPSAID